MTAQTPTGVLHRLKDSNFQVADPRGDIRGRKVLDSAGDEIGKVDDLLIDDREGRVRFIEVAFGGFLGLGETKVLLPVETVTGVRDEHVEVNQDRARLMGAPKYDPELVEHPYLSQLYGYYGYRTPFWDPAYIYPRYPYF